MSQLQTNLTNLQAILNNVNDLPNINGSSSSAPKMCDITIEGYCMPGDAPSFEDVYYIAVKNGIVSREHINYKDYDGYENISDNGSTILTTISVMQNSYIIIHSSNGYCPIYNLSSNSDNIAIVEDEYGPIYDDSCLILSINDSAMVGNMYFNG